MSSNPVKISVIVPSFNQGNYIENTILSVLNQEYENWEMIIQDGESSDNTSEVCRKYEIKDSRIHFYSERDNGFADAVNKALKRCNGDLIGVQSSDDYYSCSTVFYDVNALKKKYPNLSLIAGQSIPVSSNHNYIIYQANVESDIFLQPPSIFTLANSFPQGASFFSKERAFYVNCFDMEVDMVADTDFWIRFCCYQPVQINSIYQTGKIWGCVTIHSQQRSSDLIKFYLGRAHMAVKHYKDPQILYCKEFKLSHAKNLILTAIEYFNSLGRDARELFLMYEDLTQDKISPKKLIKNHLSKSNFIRKLIYPEIKNSIYESLKSADSGYSSKWF